MIRKKLLILGAGLMQKPAITIAKEMGLWTVVADGNADAECAPLADHFEAVDLKDREGILEYARREAVDGILTAGTDFSATVAYAAEKLGLPGIPYEAALNASDKSRMRKCFAAKGVPSPQVLFEVGAYPVGANNYSPLQGGFTAFPAVVKPVDNMGARGCRRVDTEAQLKEALADAARFSRSGRIIIEEFMPGPEYSVDALIFDGKMIVTGLADRHIFFPPYFIEMGHTLPADFNREPREQNTLLEVFEQGARALGLLEKGCYGAAKGDIKFTDKGPMIGEIAARLSGGYMSGWTYPYSSGIEPSRGAIYAALGKMPPDEFFVPKRQWTSAERAFISIPGKVKAVYGKEAAEKTPFVKNIFYRISEGSSVQFPENNVQKCGNVITAAPTREEAVKAAEDACRTILIRLECPNAATEEFLSLPPLPPPQAGGDVDSLTLPLSPPLAGGAGGGVFPPDAFSTTVDYQGRTWDESLDIVNRISGIPSDNPVYQTEEFIQAHKRGGYQGALYYLEKNGRA
ncbi:MAG: ATP-grasp domain-containing protein [Spirochaetaceae bacterium]|jgi:biotin carboxylase|nr:ATP-grasp domain-containing protein [Spirochaetaceae bacterium]